MNYFLYVRKSQESDDRQEQSIDDQIKEMYEKAGKWGIRVVDTIAEAKSAKDPGARPEFNRMLERIQAGEAEGILCWHVNRLSRNPVDSGRLQWMLQQGIIQSIRTPTQEYKPTDNVLILNIETGVSNQFIRQLRTDVARGMRSKIEKGWFPAVAPQGYLNDKAEHTIIVDPERFPLVRKMWDLMLTGTYTPRQIWIIANKEWGFRTRKSKKSGGKPMALSGVYDMFANVFYTGSFKWSNQVYEGKHPAMVTPEEFDRVQMLLGKRGKPRPKTKNFPFTGVIICGECGGMITAEEKLKYIKSKNTVRSYTYYHCTRRKTGISCSQKNSITSTELERQVNEEINTFTILPEFKDWAMEILAREDKNEVKDRSTIYETQLQTVADTQRQIDNLTGMRCREMLTDEEYIREKKRLSEELENVKKSIKTTEHRAENWLETCEKVFDFVTYATYHFNNSKDPQKKKEILLGLGQNFSMKEGKLAIEANEWLQPIKDGYPELEKEYFRLELDKKSPGSEHSVEEEQLFSRWQA